MKAKELKKYPFYIILMTISFLITMVSPLLFSYLIDEIIINGNFSMLLRWFMITFLVTAAGLVMDFYFVNYSPVKIGIRNSFKLERKSLGNILKLNQPIYAQKNKGYYYNLCQNSAGAYGDLHEEIHLNMVSNIIYVVVILSFITYVNRIFGLFFVAYGLVLVFIALNSSKPLYHMQKDILQVQDVYLTDMRNIIENKGNINAIHAEDFFNQAFKKSVTKYEKHILNTDYLIIYASICREP